jgi:hypothetical protein
MSLVSTCETFLRKSHVRGYINMRDDTRREKHGACEFQYMPIDEDVKKRGECESVEQMFEEAVVTARQVLVASAAAGEDFDPCAFMYVPVPLEGVPRVQICIIANGFHGPKAKREIGASLARFAREHKAAAIVLCTDAFGVEPPPEVTSREDAMRWHRRVGPASEQPGRFEVLNVCCVYPDATAVSVLHRYVRHPEGKGERIEWGEVRDGRDDPDNKVEQNIIPAWAEGSVQ